MSESAKERLQAIGNHLNTVPPIVKVAGDSNGPRVTGKVVIVTGKYMLFCAVAVVYCERVEANILVQRRKLYPWYWPSIRSPVCSERGKGSLHLRLR